MAMPEQLFEKQTAEVSHAHDADYAGVCAGKYRWGEKGLANMKAETPPEGRITDYSWADGKEHVSIYMKVPGIGKISKDALKADIVDKQRIVFCAKIAGKIHRFEMQKLSHAIKSVKFLFDG
eukprot:TRINITY_DN96059_c0_g1_i2.p2 TRINITY_DN96059_c0_g1~~TRINITY_DN96059_c0_g1_i2.p2  ORF type:complete len:122 (+),score=30.62 TRINITY_DN96059_c0_g1_i2:92-457(+)